MSTEPDIRAVARDLVERARAAGARAADAVVGESDGLHVGVRLGEVEKLRRARERRAGLRVFVGDSTAIVSTSDLSPAALAELAGDACALARATAPDPHAGLPDPADLAAEPPDLGLYDPAVERLEPPEALARARAAEDAARAAAAEITNSEGAEFGCGGGRVAYASSHGFAGAYAGSSFSLSVVPVATRDGAMQRDWWYTAGRHLDTLDAPADVGREAARRAVRRLGARQVATQECPVVFEAEAAASLLRHLAGALAGPALYRRASFLLGRLGERIAAPAVTVVDDPLQPGGLASRPFDGEGVASRRLTVVEAGVLKSYLLDSYAARRLGLRTTGHATRSAGDAPSAAPSNFFLTPGPHPPESIVASVRAGLYVTELIGFGVNLVTGDYSRGAAGLWIEGGELTHPVEEVTIAGNLLDMLRNVEMVGTDLRFRSACAAPTLKIARMTVAGR
ncbi:MAG TPA: metallopeptidase TldD-related protein [Candidatus Binatia bacterium]|nr:metallopeptidase TldD-related protein [Candidatus Binatia bacterium]